MNKKGFTLMEILVVVLIIAILVSLYTLTYRKSVHVRNNERARAMLVELANAAKLYNEMYPDTKISGGFGDNPQDCPGCVDPCVLFRSDNTDPLIYSYALVPGEWGLYSANACGNSLNFEGYKFYICNPYYDGSNYTAQPSGADGKCVQNGNARFAVLISPSTEDMVLGQYFGKQAWITRDYQLENNYD